MNIFFNATYYLNNNPDVLQAVAQGIIPSAKFHFDNFGWKEGRDPNAFFDVSYYLTENPDVLAAGVNPLDHFIQFGAAEGRSPNADFVSAEDFDTEAYAAANPDLEAAGITTPEGLYAHFVTYGFGEDRPGTQTNDGAPVIEGLPGGLAGDDFTLTKELDEIVGTAGNDVFQGLVEDLNLFDDIDGGAGNDVLNLYASAATGSLDIAPTVDVADIETVNFFLEEGSTLDGKDAVDADDFDSASQIWQIDGAYGVFDLDADQTAGFRDAMVDVTVNADDDVTSASVALDNVDSGAALEFTGADLTTVTVSGGVAAADKDTDGTLNLTFNSGTKGGATEVNLALTEDTILAANGSWNTIKTVDASGSTGDITATVSGGDAFAAITGGSGNDDFTIADGTFSSKTLTVDAGAGSDTVTLERTETDTAITVTLGSGADRIEFADTAGGNVACAKDDDALAAGLVTITDFSTADKDVIAIGTEFDTDFNVSDAIQNAVDALTDATLFDAFTAANGANSSKDAELVQFVYGDDLYISTDDTLIKLAGLDEALGANSFDAYQVIT